MGLYSQEGLKNKLEKLDAHHDTMFNVGHLSTLCTPDQKMAQKIKSCLHLMEALEKEMVPGMLTYAAYKKLPFLFTLSLFKSLNIDRILFVTWKPLNTY